MTGKLQVTTVVNSAKHSCGRVELPHEDMCLDKCLFANIRTVFVTNCITGYFSFLCSVESAKHSNKGFYVDYFFSTPMLLIANCNRLIMTLNKCVSFFKKNVLCKT